MSTAHNLLSNYQDLIENLTLVTGTNGVFDVIVNGELIYSKDQTGRHAEEDEVRKSFRAIFPPDQPAQG